MDSRLQKMHAARRKKVACPELGRVYDSIVDAARDFGVHKDTVTTAIKRSKKVKGFTLTFV